MHVWFHETTRMFNICTMSSWCNDQRTSAIKFCCECFNFGVWNTFELFFEIKKKKKLEASATLRDTFKAVRGEQLGAGLPLRNSPVVLQFKNVSMKLKSNGAEIVKGVSGYFPPGSLVALMVSGSFWMIVVFVVFELFDLI